MQEKLSDLRKAATNSNWNECIQITTELLEKLSYRQCVLLATKYVEEYLPIFENYHPNTNWPRGRLNEILKKTEDNTTTSPTAFILPEVNSEFDTPGSNGFIKELENLWELVFSVEQEQNYSNKAASITSGIIMARLTYDWAYRHQEEWYKWYYSLIQQETDDTLEPTYLTFMNDPIFVKLEVTEWYRLADQIQKLLVS